MAVPGLNGTRPTPAAFTQHAAPINRSPTPPGFKMMIGVPIPSHPTARPSDRSRHGNNPLGLLICLLLLGSPGQTVAAPREPEGSDPSGTLFEAFAKATARGERALLPDYSHVGYHRCDRPLPTVSRTTHKYFDVTDFGAVADDARSDRDAALAALEAAHHHPGPAVVYFPKGNFRLFEASDFGKPPLEIKRSEIVIKGSGVGTTQLEFAESHLPARALILMRSSSGKEDYWRGDLKLNARITRQVDSFSVEVSDASQLKAGMRINLNARMDPTTEVAKQFFCPHEVPPGIIDQAHQNGGLLDRILELHEIEKLEGNLVTFNAPIHLDLKAHTNITLYRIDGIIEECGIEDLSLRGGWKGQFKHHNGTRYSEDFRMVEMDRVFNSWLRRIRFTEFSSAISTWMSGFNSITNVLLEGNAGHRSITCRASYGNLYAFVREQTDTHHGLGVSRSSTNTVFYRCLQYESLEAHCAYPRATLYDLNEGGFHPRGGGATYFPMHDKGLTFWNWNVTRPGSFDFWPEGERYGYFLNPIIAGLHGEKFTIPDIEKDLLAYESPGRKTSPESLLDAQLILRRGALPEWFADASNEFETVSRHSAIEIISPENHSAHSGVTVKMALHQSMDPMQVSKVELLASKSGVFDGFVGVGTVELENLSHDFQPETPGVWVLKAKLTNRRGEICHSRPITVFTGDPDELKRIQVTKSAMISGDRKNDLYQDFVRKGGAEAPRLKGSKILAARLPEQPIHELEKPYRRELHEFYTEYGATTFAAALDNQGASAFFDMDTRTTGPSISSYEDTLVQAAFPSSEKLCRVDIHWKNRVPKKEARLEIQTSGDPAAWFSVVNDDRLWTASSGRIGGTLMKEKVPGTGNVSTFYIPEREAGFVRMLFTSFPSGATEIRFYGP